MNLAAHMYIFFFLRNLIEHSDWAKLLKKNSLKECVFVNSAPKVQCHVVKNTLL